MCNRMANFSEFDNFDVDKDPLIRRAAAEDEFDDEEEFVHEPPAVMKTKKQIQDLTGNW